MLNTLLLAAGLLRASINSVHEIERKQNTPPLLSSSSFSSPLLSYYLSLFPFLFSLPLPSLPLLYLPPLSLPLAFLLSSFATPTPTRFPLLFLLLLFLPYITSLPTTLLFPLIHSLHPHPILP